MWEDLYKRSSEFRGSASTEEKLEYRERLNGLGNIVNGVSMILERIHAIPPEKMNNGEINNGQYNKNIQKLVTLGGAMYEVISLSDQLVFFNQPTSRHKINLVVNTKHQNKKIYRIWAEEDADYIDYVIEVFGNRMLALNIHHKEFFPDLAINNYSPKTTILDPLFRRNLEVTFSQIVKVLTKVAQTFKEEIDLRGYDPQLLFQEVSHSLEIPIETVEKIIMGMTTTSEKVQNDRKKWIGDPNRLYTYRRRGAFHLIKMSDGSERIFASSKTAERTVQALAQNIRDKRGFVPSLWIMKENLNNEPQEVKNLRKSGSDQFEEMIIKNLERMGIVVSSYLGTIFNDQNKTIINIPEGIGQIDGLGILPDGTILIYDAKLTQISGTPGQAKKVSREFGRYDKQLEKKVNWILANYDDVFRALGGTVEPGQYKAVRCAVIKYFPNVSDITRVTGPVHTDAISFLFSLAKANLDWPYEYGIREKFEDDEP